MSKPDAWGFTTQAQLKAVDKYNRDTTKTYCLRLNLHTDLDVIRWLDGQQSKQGAIKKLIREQIARDK